LLIPGKNISAFRGSPDVIGYEADMPRSRARRRDELDSFAIAGFGMDK
jgi:hypothetical protein